jgi:hypothetical protein
MTAVMMAGASFEFEEFLSEVASAIASHVGTENDEVAAPVADHATRATPPVDSFILDHEKVVWHFPDTMARIIEEIG